MGWFAHRGTTEQVKLNAIGITNNLLESSDPVQFGDNLKLDRKWEITAINVPSVIIRGAVAVRYHNIIPQLPAEVETNFSSDIDVNLSVSILNSGLTIGSINQSLSLSPVSSTLLKTNEAGFSYSSGVFAMSDSLPSPIVFQGPESLACTFSVSSSFARVKNYVGEQEEGTGESKHIVKEEIAVEEVVRELEVNNGTPSVGAEIILYINESSSVDNV